VRRGAAHLVSTLIALSSATLATRAACAQTSMHLESPRRVEVDQPFTVQIVINSQNGGSPSNARLPVPRGVRSAGPRTSTQTQVTITNGRMVQQSGVTLSWTLSAPKPGTLHIGPPSVDIDGETHKGQAFDVEVVAPLAGGRLPQRGQPVDPFDPFGMFPGFPNFPNFPRGLPFPSDDREPELPAVPPEYQLDHAKDPTAFLVAKASPRKVVIGQAVGVQIYAYAGAGAFQGVSPTEPSRDGFLSYDVETEPQGVAIMLDGKRFFAQKITDLVLFPIRTGSLRIGSMRLGFAGRNYRAPAGALGVMRESEPIDITVVEPPLAERPAGYRLGDVGDYKLRAAVDPKSVREGEAVSVIATLEGNGNLPSKLDVPQQNGVDWMDPTLIEKLEARTGVVSGTRTFTYVVRLDHAGSVDLGELTLPFYNPERGRYEIARATLGRVEVRPDPNKATAPAPNAPSDRLSGLLSPKLSGKPAEPVRYLADTHAFFAWLAAGPFSVLLANGLVRVGRRLRQRVGARQDTPARKAARELDAARSLAQNHATLESVGGPVERALHFAIEAATGLKGRGVLRSELVTAMSARGASTELAERAVALLAAIENARFVPGDENSAADLANRAEGVVRELLRGARA
jgi:hypothetical protein